MGATYTPPTIVDAMVQWASLQTNPDRVVDPGAGSGRFVVAAGRAFAAASLVAVELDLVAAVLCRGHVAAAGLSERCEVRAEDYRKLALPSLPEGRRTLFIGNPPYVRHHLIDPHWKRWLAAEGRALGLQPSGLAGLHVHFLVATARKARPGDIACFITSAEWLDVNYGRMMRELFLNGMGGRRIVVVDPTAKPFADADTTAVITCMEAGTNADRIAVRRVSDCSRLSGLEGGRLLARTRLRKATRWSRLTRPGRRTPRGYVELGEMCRVHRGQVTGANAVWIAEKYPGRLPRAALFPAVTRARELYEAGGELRVPDSLRHVIDLPEELESLGPEAQRQVDAFLAWAKAQGAHETYIAKHRRPWWSVGLREPAPILATYMARRPPAFVRNTANARHLNIAHGLYPREPLSGKLLRRLAEYLSENVRLEDGRTYAGGLTKFEPGEMQRLIVPGPELLAAAGGCLR